MRILQVVHQFPPERVGGTEIYTLGITKGLLARGHQVAVFHRASGPPGLRKAAWDGVTVYVGSDGPMTAGAVFRATFGNARLKSAFVQALAEIRPELVHVQHLMGLPPSLLSQARRGRIPVVLTLHDYWFICPNAQLLTNCDQTICHGPRLGGINCGRCALARAGLSRLRPAAPALAPLFAWRRTQLRRVLNQARRVIAPSRFLMRLMTKWGAPAGRLVHLPNGVDINGVQPRVARPAGPVRFSYIGGLAVQKGVHVVVEAANHLAREATLDIYGDPDQFPEYVESLRSVIRTPNIRLGGRLDRQGVWRALSETDVLVVPSLWYENAPVVIQEAFAAGVPVIASDLGAVPEWVQDGVNGVLVAPGDVEAWRKALEQLVDEPDLLLRLQANVRPPMTVHEHLDRLEGLYGGLVSDEPGNDR
jgi:glycosyltransferase involved in cell wall biosynthesis